MTHAYKNTRKLVMQKGWYTREHQKRKSELSAGRGVHHYSLISVPGDGDTSALVTGARFTRCVCAHEEVGHKLPTRGAAEGTAGTTTPFTATETATTALVHGRAHVVGSAAVSTTTFTSHLAAGLLLLDVKTVVSVDCDGLRLEAVYHRLVVLESHESKVWHRSCGLAVTGSSQFTLANIYSHLLNGTIG